MNPVIDSTWVRDWSHNIDYRLTVNNYLLILWNGATQQFYDIVIDAAVLTPTRLVIQFINIHEHCKLSDYDQILWEA